MPSLRAGKCPIPGRATFRVGFELTYDCVLNQGEIHNVAEDGSRKRHGPYASKGS